jgi:hypothetical protein
MANPDSKKKLRDMPGPPTLTARMGERHFVQDRFGVVRPRELYGFKVKIPQHSLYTLRDLIASGKDTSVITSKWAFLWNLIEPEPALRVFLYNRLSDSFFYGGRYVESYYDKTEEGWFHRYAPELPFEDRLNNALACEVAIRRRFLGHKLRDKIYDFTYKVSDLNNDAASQGFDDRYAIGEPFPPKFATLDIDPSHCVYKISDINFEYASKWFSGRHRNFFFQRTGEVARQKIIRHIRHLLINANRLEEKAYQLADTLLPFMRQRTRQPRMDHALLKQKCATIRATIKEVLLESIECKAEARTVQVYFHRKFDAVDGLPMFQLRHLADEKLRTENIARFLCRTTFSYVRMLDGLIRERGHNLSPIQQEYLLDQYTKGFYISPLNTEAQQTWSEDIKTHITKYYELLDSTTEKEFNQKRNRKRIYRMMIPKDPPLDSDYFAVGETMLEWLREYKTLLKKGKYLVPPPQLWPFNGLIYDLFMKGAGPDGEDAADKLSRMVQGQIDEQNLVLVKAGAEWQE